MHLNLQRKSISTVIPDTRSVQENFNLITSFIQDSADKHIPSKTHRTVSSVPLDYLGNKKEDSQKKQNS